MRVLVTGGTSLIGAAVAERLLAAGHDVVVFQRHSSNSEHAEVLGDVVDRAAVESAVAGRDAVVHLAARVGVTGSWEQFEATNIVGTANVIAAARAAGATRFIQVSSPSVAHTGHSLVGAPATLPADPAHARGHYARSKARAELVALDANVDGFAVAAIRPHLVWGPGDTQLVGRIVERAKQGRLALVGSGAALIDTTYIDNAADAIAAAVERAEVIAGLALVVSNAQPRPVQELFSRIVGAAGLDGPRRRVPFGLARTGGAIAEWVWDRRGRADDPPMTSFLAEQLATAHWFSQAETQRMLDWTPRVRLEEGFARLRSWFEANPV